jgi:hypothetical protein
MGGAGLFDLLHAWACREQVLAGFGLGGGRSLGGCGLRHWARRGERRRGPAAAVRWAGSTTQTIAWTKSGVQNDYVRVQLLRNGITVRDISTKTPNDGSFEWNIPGTLAASSNYLIRVKTVDGLVKDDSGLFSIDQESSPRAALKSTRLQAKHS